jgi:hypothetical protein
MVNEQPEVADGEWKSMKIAKCGGLKLGRPSGPVRTGFRF